VGVVFVDLASANKGFLFALDPQAVVKASSENIQPSNSGSRIFYYRAQNNLHPSSVVIKRHLSYPEFVAAWFRNVLPNAGIFYGVEYLQEIDALSRRSYAAFLAIADALEPQAQIRLLRAFNVGHVVSFRPLSIPGLMLSREFPEYYSSLYEIEDPLPRAYVVDRNRVEKNAIRTLQTLADEAFDPRAEVLLDRQIPIRATRKFQAECKFLLYGNSHVTIETNTSGDGILVLLDSYYPGWKAYVDGTETTIVRANHFYRAVLVPKGRHLVDFKYEPLSFKIGLIISSITIFSIVVISLMMFLRKEQSLQRFPLFRKA
jgi:hypothetical protein